ncbi:MAG: hypothetical protein LBG20_01640 [Holosporaceae bacterium]|jgi:hypothetical protein|nr:hypothetical protein [Holosporaceae bacterium]
MKRNLTSFCAITVLLENMVMLDAHCASRHLATTGGPPTRKMRTMSPSRQNLNDAILNARSPYYIAKLKDTNWCLLAEEIVRLQTIEASHSEGQGFTDQDRSYVETDVFPHCPGEYQNLLFFAVNVELFQTPEGATRFSKKLLARLPRAFYPVRLSWAYKSFDQLPVEKLGEIVKSLQTFWTCGINEDEKRFEPNVDFLIEILTRAVIPASAFHKFVENGMWGSILETNGLSPWSLLIAAKISHVPSAATYGTFWGKLTEAAKETPTKTMETYVDLLCNTRHFSLFHEGRPQIERWMILQDNFFIPDLMYRLKKTGRSNSEAARMLQPYFSGLDTIVILNQSGPDAWTRDLSCDELRDQMVRAYRFVDDCEQNMARGVQH